MNLKKSAVLICALLLALSSSACTKSENSSSEKNSNISQSVSSINESSNESESSSESSETETSDSSEAETSQDSSDSEAESSKDSNESNSEAEQNTKYDVNGDFRCYDKLKEKYSKGYTLSLVGQMSMADNSYVICVSGKKAYMATLISKQKQYAVAPGDGKIYNVSEASKKYNTQKDDSTLLSSADILFSPATEFSKAAFSDDKGTIFEYYKMDKNVTGKDGEIIYGFDANTYDLKQIVLSPEGSDEPVYFSVEYLKDVNKNFLKKPDLTGYKKIK